MNEKSQPLTAEQKEAYLKDSGKCPRCKSTDITGDSIEVDGDSAWQNVSCSECNETWTDVYTLSYIDDE